MTVIYVERESHTTDARFSALTVKDKDDKQRVAGSDYAVPIIDINHLRLHEGNAYYAYKSNNKDNKLNNNSHIDIVITSNVGYHAHIRVFAELDGDGEFIVHENVSATGGSIFVPINRNRISTNTSEVGCLINPTVTINNGAIDEVLILGGTRSNANSGKTNLEYILKDNVSYLFRLTNKSGSAQQAFMSLEWYE